MRQSNRDHTNSRTSSSIRSDRGCEYCQYRGHRSRCQCALSANGRTSGGTWAHPHHAGLTSDGDPKRNSGADTHTYSNTHANAYRYRRGSVADRVGRTGNDKGTCNGKGTCTCTRTRR